MAVVTPGMHFVQLSVLPGTALYSPRGHRAAMPDDVRYEPAGTTAKHRAQHSMRCQHDTRCDGSRIMLPQCAQAGRPV